MECGRPAGRPRVDMGPGGLPIADMAPAKVRGAATQLHHAGTRLWSLNRSRLFVATSFPYFSIVRLHLQARKPFDITGQIFRGQHAVDLVSGRKSGPALDQ